MNYRHAYHAGSFADVFKHALVARILVYLMRKDAPLRYLDTHAGVGLYDLAKGEAARAGEWREGVGRLARARPPHEVRAMLEPYFAALRLTPNAVPTTYPGSPLLALRLLRPQDRLTLCELHEQDHRALIRALARDRRAKALRIDGYVALNAYAPPPERRGLCLVDPPFEANGEFGAIAQALERAWAKWPTGVYALWYPLKHPREADAFAQRLSHGAIKRVMRLELEVAAWSPDAPLSGTGLIVVNPPFALEAEARILLPWLTRLLARDARARWRIDWLARE